jgi:hypothetical protein
MPVRATLLACALLAAACTSPRNSAQCVPGDQKSCPCLGGGSGIQVCLPDGTYQACLCPPEPDLGIPNFDGGAGDDLAGVPGSGTDLAGGGPGGSDLGATSDLAGKGPVYDLAGSDFTTASAADLSGTGSDAGITCGAATCSSAQLCCLAGSPTKGTCAPSSTGCDGGDSPFACDGPENCPGAQCCVYVNTGTGGGVTGHAECGNACVGSVATSGTGAVILQTRLCHSDTDCASFSGTLLGASTPFSACCHSAATAPYHVCIPPNFASIGAFTCP